MLDGTQTVVTAYRYDPFGKLLTKTSSLTQPFGFSTKRYDTQTGLIYYGYRFYSPTIGRWTTRDPLGEAGGMNLYAFVGNNPVNWVDPWGLAHIFDTTGTIAWRKIVREQYLDFAPTWLLDMFMPITPEGIGSELSDAAMGMVCPLNISGTGKGAGKSLKELIKQIAEHARKHNPRMVKDDLIELIGEVIQRGKQSGDYKELPGGREAYFDDLTGRIVILDPKSPHGGSSFLPKRGRAYFDELKPR